MTDKKNLDAKKIANVKQVIAIMELSGHKFTAEEIEELNEIALGKKTTAQAINELNEEIEQLRVSNPEKFYQKEDKKEVQPEEVPSKQSDDDEDPITKKIREEVERLRITNPEIFYRADKE